VEGNMLSVSEKNAMPENGIVVNNSGTTTNKIYRNTFTKIQVPVNAQNINRLPNGSIGLQLLCNNINECTVNDMVVTYDVSQPNPNNCGIKMNQGNYSFSPITPAGNLFTKGGSGYINYTNSTPNMVYYAHYSTDLITYQNKPHYLIPRIAANSNITLKDTHINWDPTNWKNIYCKDETVISSGVGKSLSVIEALKQQIGELQFKIDSTSAALQPKMDNGNTQQLINRINTCATSGYNKLYNDLRRYSPYMSEEALLAVIHKQGFPTNYLVNLMLVNTHVAKTPLLMEALQAVQPPLTNGQLNQIYNKYKDFSAMEKDRMK